MKRVQRIGFTTALSDTFTGVVREITIDTDLWNLRVHDGVTPGGHTILTKANADAVYAPRDDDAYVITSGLFNINPNGEDRDFVVEAVGHPVAFVIQGSDGQAYFDNTVTINGNLVADNLPALPLAFVDGGTGASYANAAALRAGLSIQTLDATLTALAGVATAADKLIYATAADTFTTTDLTSFARTVLDDTDAATARATLNAASLATANAFTAAQTVTLGTAGTNMALVTTDAGAIGSLLTLYHNSASPAANDVVGDIQLQGKSSTGVQRTLAGLQVVYDTTTNAAEMASLHLRSIQSGTLGDRVIIKNGMYTVGASSGDMGANTINASGLYWDGVSAVIVGKNTMWIPAGAFKPRSSNGCANLAGVSAGSGQPDLWTCDFDAAVIEYAQANVKMPKSWNLGTFTAIFVWKHAATVTNFGVVWGFQGVCIGDNETAAAAYGTAQEVTDTGGTTNNIYHSPETSACTFAGSIAAQDWASIQVYRNATSGSDTLAVDAGFIGIAIFYTTNAKNDA